MNLKRLSLITLCALVISILMCGVALAVPVQWDPSDGGNGHHYDMVWHFSPFWQNCRDKAAATTLNYNGTTYNGHLVTITSPAEQGFLSNRFMLPDWPRVWIGAYRDYLAPSGFAWVTGEPWGYTHWHSGEPNNAYGPENYVEMWGSYFGGWNDRYSPAYDPYGTNSYIIEWDTPPYTNTAPVVNAGANSTIDEGSIFTSTGSFTDPDADSWTAIVNYGDGTGDQSLVLNPDKTFNLSHVYADNGNYTITVKVNDGKGGSAIGTTMVTVNNVAPTATLNTEPVNEGSPFTVSLTSPSDPSSVDTAAGFTYAFDLGSGYGDFGSENSISGPTTDDAVISVKAKIMDKDGGVTEYSGTVTVNNVAPVISDMLDVEIHKLSYAGSGSFTDPGADTWNATVNYGDGTADKSLELNADKTFALNNIYTTAGSYIVSVTVKDDDGGFGTETFIVNITPIEVQIDIKPGSYPNSFNVNGTGAIPIVILGSETFNVEDIDVSSISFAGLTVKMVGKNDKALAHIEDITGPDCYPDGTNLVPDTWADLVVQIADTDGTLVIEGTTGTLTGKLIDGTLIAGSDEINIVPN